MINKMAEFPNDVTVNKPVPCKSSFKDGMFFKKPDAKYDCSNWNKSSDKSIQNIRKERYLVIDGLKLSKHQGHGDFQYQHNGEQRPDNGDKTIRG